MDNEPRLKGPFLIKQELDELYQKKYSDVLVKSSKEHRADMKKFKMKAKQIQEMQDIVQASMGTELPYGEYMKMFKADLLEFFVELN